MKKHTRNYSILLVLAIVFAAPGLAAYVIYQHPNWISASRINKGTLLNPPLELSSLKTQPKWQIIFWTPGLCKKECWTQLDVLARVRLALGRKLYMVDQKLILGSNTPLSSKKGAQLQNLDMHLTQLSPEDQVKLNHLSSNATIFIANPDNFLVMSYPSNVNPDYIYKDIKVLLNTTGRKSD